MKNRKSWLENGETEITSSYNLKEKQGIKYVIHAVGPVWKDGYSKEKEQLRDCVRNSLAKFEGKEIKSISFPAISSGIFGFPKDLCADIMIKTAILIIEKRETGVEEIRFTNFDMPTVKVFQEKFEEILKKYDPENDKFNFTNVAAKDPAPRIFLSILLKNHQNCFFRTFTTRN